MSKTGRKKTGLSRPHIVQVALNAEEYEFVARLCYDQGISSAMLGRMKMLIPGWREKLQRLRQAQKYAPLNQLDGRRK